MIDAPDHYKVTALLGAYVQEYRPAGEGGGYEIIGRIAAGGDLEENLHQMSQLTRDMELPFSRWDACDAEQVIQKRIDLQLAYDALPAHEVTGRYMSDEAFSGGGCTAYLVNKETDHPIVMKDMRQGVGLAKCAESVEQRLKTLIPGQDIEGFEQVACIRYDTGSTGTFFLPGKSLTLLKPEDLYAIQPDHLAALTKTVRRVSEQLIVLDFFGVGNNVNFHPKSGLGIYDALGLALDKQDAWSCNADALLMTIKGLGGIIREGLPRLNDSDLAALRSKLASQTATYIEAEALILQG